MLITDKEKLKQFDSENRIWQGVGAIERTKKGRIFSTFYSGNCRETLGNFCPLLISDDDGFTWSEPICVAYAGESYRCYDPALWIDPLGRLWFIWNVEPIHAAFASICENPDADSLVWSEPFLIAEGNIITKPIVLSSGEWLFPVANWQYNVLCSFYDATEVRFDKNDKDIMEHCNAISGANVYKTVDNGKTFTFLGGCKHILSPNYEEPSLFERKDGVLVFYMRTRLGVARSFSYDRGVTWTVAEDFNITGPVSKLFVRRLKSGRLLLVNHHNFKGRNNLTALLSEDDGETYPYTLLLDERDNVSYPDFTEGDDGYIYISYDRERGDCKESIEEAEKCAREILFAKICEQDIIEGKLVSKDSRLKQITSKLTNHRETCEYYKHIANIDAQSIIKRNSSLEQMLNEIFNYYPLNCRNQHCADYRKIESLIKKAEDEKENLLPILSELISYLHDITLKAKFVEYVPVVESVLEYLQNNPSENVSLNTLADKIGVNVYYMCHVFKKKTGLSIVEYHNASRLLHAKNMLINTQKSITTISQECGFTDASYFTLKFKKSEGITPSKYRKLNFTKK